MITETLAVLTRSSIQLVRSWRVNLILAAIYAVLLSTIYLFITSREASITQLVFTLILGLAAIGLFFTLQAIAADDIDESAVRRLLRRSLSNGFKIVLVSVPIITLALLAFYLLSKAEHHYSPALAVTNVNVLSNQPATARVPWPVALFTSLRYVTLGLILPLTLMQFWIATVRIGLRETFRHITSLLVRAFSAQAVLIYMTGFLLFGVLPYLVLRQTITVQHAWLGFSVFGGRLIVAFALTLFGWVLTIRSLNNFTGLQSAEAAKGQ